jgi:DNA-binding transcriptional LysR family regulator
VLLKQLEGLAALFETGSFPEAARSLNVPLATLRTRIRMLEREFGVEVVRRSGRGVELTEIGWQILPHARRMADLAREASDILARPSESRLSVGCVEVASESLIAPALRAFADQRPGASVTMLRGDGLMVREMLADGRARLGFLTGEYDRSRFRSLWSHEEPVDALVSGAQPVAQADLARLPIAVVAGEPALEEIAGRLGPPRWRVDSVAVAKDLALGGRVISVLPVRAARAELAAGSLRRLSPPALTGTAVRVHCLAVRSSTPTPDERHFLKVLSGVR